MSEYIAGRAQMGTSLGFHIVFAMIGVGLPCFCWWSRASVSAAATSAGHSSRDAGVVPSASFFFAVGAVSGTVLSFELGLLWPGFMGYAGGIIGLPFSMEGFAFFIEAIFLGLYLYGWERLSPLAHWLCTIPLTISGAASAWFVVTANAWMNSPTGFRLDNGRVTDVHPIQAIFNPGTPIETAHVMISSYLATGFAVAAVYAVGILRGRRGEIYRKGLLVGMIMGSIATPLQVITGDINARWVADNQPAKLAAMEGEFKTETGAPLRIGGLPDLQAHETRYAIEIPWRALIPRLWQHVRDRSRPRPPSPRARPQIPGRSIWPSTSWSGSASPSSAWRPGSSSRSGGGGACPRSPAAAPVVTASGCLSLHRD